MLNYLVCPNCNDSLVNQPGFAKNLGYWKCKKCGTLLTDPNDPDFQNESGNVWFCDCCGECLNKQAGFTENVKYWVCTVCGKREYFGKTTGDGPKSSCESDNFENDNNTGEAGTSSDIPEVILLKNLKDRLENYSDAKIKFESASRNLNEAEHYKSTKVLEFDNANKDKFIESQVGSEPKKPKNIMILTGPVYIAKKKAYEEELAKYKKKKEAAEEEYYIKFEEEREKLKEEDKSKQSNLIISAKKEYALSKKKLTNVRETVEKDDLLGPELKKMEVITALIGYFANKRVDTIRDAVNLYYEEQHRKRLEELAEEQLRLTQEALNAANEAASNASEAIERVDELEERLNEAYKKAEDAFERAEEAYDKAEEAYNNSSDDY